jgi:hypothetical protein
MRCWACCCRGTGGRVLKIDEVRQRRGEVAGLDDAVKPGRSKHELRPPSWDVEPDRSYPLRTMRSGSTIGPASC